VSPKQAAELTVVLADDHNIVREGFAALCAMNGMRILAQCADGETALCTIQSAQPDLAILDQHMPVLSGTEVIRRLRGARCRSKLLILSISRDLATVRGALRAGADAYLLKDGPSRHLTDAIQFVREGGVYVSPLLRGAALFAAPADEPSDPLSALSARERQVFAYLTDGMRPKEIAAALRISPKTVDTYRASVMRKLRVSDLVGLVKFAIEKNLTKLSVSI
jgi:DNA-binding NarL/FixJ family response regulator